MAHDPQRRKQLAKRLKAARVKAKLTIPEASERITGWGVAASEWQVMNWEGGTGKIGGEPFPSDLPILAKVYGCRVADFFEG